MAVTKASKRFKVSNIFMYEISSPDVCQKLRPNRIFGLSLVATYIIHIPSQQHNQPLS